MILTKEVLPLKAFGYADEISKCTDLDRLYVLHRDGELTEDLEANLTYCLRKCSKVSFSPGQY